METYDLSNKFKHHLATATAFAFLIIWYFALQHFGFFDWVVAFFNEEYQGSGLMLAIGGGMTPAFFIWSRFNRWVEAKLEIKGMYYEDSYYKDKE